MRASEWHTSPYCLFGSKGVLLTVTFQWIAPHVRIMVWNGRSAKSKVTAMTVTFQWIAPDVGIMAGQLRGKVPQFLKQNVQRYLTMCSITVMRAAEWHTSPYCLFGSKGELLTVTFQWIAPHVRITVWDGRSAKRKGTAIPQTKRPKLSYNV